jgi:hypothetical protein
VAIRSPDSRLTISSNSPIRVTRVLYGNRYRELGLGKGLGLVILHYYALETGFGELGLGIRLRIAMQPIRSHLTISSNSPIRVTRVPLW